MTMEIIRNDLTKMDVDAIVNASNTELRMGGGVSGAIFAASGAEALKAECEGIGGCGVGEAVITSGFGLPAKFIIHTAGPIWRGGGFQEEELLRSCYRNALNLALKNGCRSVAFPLIASGIYGYPKDKALQSAISAIGGFLMEHELEVYLVVYDRNSFALSEKLFSSVEKYIDDNYVDEHLGRNIRGNEFLEGYSKQVRISECIDSDMAPPKSKKRKLEDVLEQVDETFSVSLLRLIDEKGMRDVDTYKNANIDRKLFSKIRNGNGYKPNKKTALSLAIALRLNLDETRDLLAKAGFVLSRSSKFDLIVEYFIQENNCSIFEINQALFKFLFDTLSPHK
jgi:O-acetyl-ADP-ribose deacetylase (regulator of RNase III)